MKRLHLLAVAFVSVASCLAQNVPPPETNNIEALTPTPLELDYQSTARDEISTTWEANEQITNAVTGAVSTRSHRYIEIGSGINYFDETTGFYVPSEDLIELTDDGGAAAIRGPARLFLKPNANSAEAITTITGQGRKFTSRPLGVFWYDARSGATQLIAPAADCAGELLPPNQVVWRGAFGPLGDLRVTYTKSAIETDLILLQQPPLPDGWDPGAARIEFWEEWTAPGEPAINPRSLRSESDANLKSAMAEPDLTDQILDFGDLWFPTGEAYATNERPDSGPNQPRPVTVPHLTDEKVPVAKTWLSTPTKTILINGVRWQDARSKLATLPQAPASAPLQAAHRLDLLDQLPNPSPDSGAREVIKQASADYHPVGFVLDPTTVPSSGTSYTFASSTTYFVNSPTYFSGTLTFQPGCIIKFNGNSLLTYGYITCNGTTGNPSILTEYHENLWGDVIDKTACPVASASPALWVYFINSNLTIQRMRFRFAQTALRLDANGCGTYTHTVSNCTFEECPTSISSSQNCNVTITSSTRSNSGAPLASSCGTITGSLTDIGSTDSDGNHLLDRDDYKYFGAVGTLPGNAAGQLTYRTGGHSPSTDQPIWSTRNDTNPPSGTYVYNTSGWLYGTTGLTAFAVFNFTNWYNGALYPGSSGATMITPRHAVVAGHFHPAVDYPIRFVGSNNATYSRVVKGFSKIPNNGDYAIIALNIDLPPEVGFVRILPVDVEHKLTASQEKWQLDIVSPACQSSRLPSVSFNRYKEAFIDDIVFLNPGAQMVATPSVWFSAWGSYCHRVTGCQCLAGSNIEGGDSSSPNFLLLNNELVLIGAWTACGDISSWQGNTLADLNQTIVTLDTATFGAWTGYSATTYPVSGFPPLW